MRIARLAIVLPPALMIPFPASARQAPAIQPVPAGKATQLARQFRRTLMDDPDKPVGGVKAAAHNGDGKDGTVSHNQAMKRSDAIEKESA
jgi:hypothetical protein